MNAPERPTPFWSLSFHFDNWDRAGLAYEQSRNAAFSQEMDAGVYRVLLNAKAYVVVIGWGTPKQSFVEQISELCHQGESSEIADEVVLTLALRHEQFRVTPGLQYERRSKL